MFRPVTVAPKVDALVRMDCSGAATMVCFDVSRFGHIAAHGIVVGVVTHGGGRRRLSDHGLTTQGVEVAQFPTLRARLERFEADFMEGLSS